MDITRTTVPGIGTVHHCTTRSGQHFGVLVDNAGRRQLLLYGSADLDVPLQSIVMEHDEADRAAEILHSQPVPDRLAALERRFAEITGEAQSPVRRDDAV
ncbi:hypothetical protein [Herbidospora daliensis]|uniref:hypothetical protein n=1 Tax=Herbidospora daliensis TaxID=295585 RepID=UPI0007822437|nr:hypothetical protein [Herbidospora daliensis]